MTRSDGNHVRSDRVFPLSMVLLRAHMGDASSVGHLVRANICEIENR